MSDQAEEQPSDWRRRRSRSDRDAGRERGASPAAPEEAQDTELSRTIFSFLEPTVDAIASFSAPIVIAGVIGLISGISMVAFIGSLQLYGIVNIIIGASLIGLVSVISLSAVIAAFFSRTGKYGVNTVIMLAAFTGILAVANFISFENHSRIDVTATNQFSLATRTKQLLDDLPGPVLATAFYKDTARRTAASATNERGFQRIARKSKVEETLKEFAARSSKFSFRMVDPDLHPVIASNYFGTLATGFVEESVVVEGTVVVDGQEITVIDVVQPTNLDYSEFEQDLVTSILVATGEETKTVYFLAGHGERGIDNAQGDGYSALRRGLEQENYDVRILEWDADDEDVRFPAEAGLRNCATGEEPLPEAALVVIARPSGELPLAHAVALTLYINGQKRVSAECTAGSQAEADDWVADHDGPSKWDTIPISDGKVQVWPKDEIPNRLVERREPGRMIFLAEPDTKDSFRAFLATLGVVVDDRHIRDLERSVPGNPFTLRLSIFNTSDADASEIDPATEAAKKIIEPRGASLDTVFMPGATALSVRRDDPRIPVPLAGTSRNSFLISDVSRTEPITGAGDESDVQGVFFPAVLMHDINLVVFGDSDFVANAYYDTGSGADLFLNSANYLMGDFSLVTIREKGFAFREFNLNLNERKFVRWSSWIMLPGLLGLMAGLVWWLRR